MTEQTENEICGNCGKEKQAHLESNESLYCYIGQFHTEQFTPQKQPKEFLSGIHSQVGQDVGSNQLPMWNDNPLNPTTQSQQYSDAELIVSDENSLTKKPKGTSNRAGNVPK